MGLCLHSLKNSQRIGPFQIHESWQKRWRKISWDARFIEIKNDGHFWEFQGPEYGSSMGERSQQRRLYIIHKWIKW